MLQFFAMTWDAGTVLADIACAERGGTPTAVLIEIFSALREYTLPHHVLPLSFQRRPFAQLGDKALLSVVSQALTYPEKAGRLTGAARQVLGISTHVKGASTLVSEAHIDLTEADASLTEKLIRIGFEPDHFFKIVPEKYKKHFTIKFSIQDSGTDRKRTLFRLTRACARDAQIEIQGHPRADGYVEIEWYKDAEWANINTKVRRNRIRRPQRSLRLEATTDASVRRVADIHVKIPSHLSATDASASLDDALDSCRADLLGIGFYEIMSEAGNYIYTAHFADILETGETLRYLDQVCDESDQMRVCHEICVDLWRKRSGSDEAVLAETPPIMRVFRGS